MYLASSEAAVRFSFLGVNVFTLEAFYAFIKFLPDSSCFNMAIEYDLCFCSIFIMSSSTLQ